MHHEQFRFDVPFRVRFGNRHAQVAEMVLATGETTGGPDNNHRGSDQWLFIASGTGQAVIENKKIALRPGSTVLIERGENHEIRNTGGHALRIFTFYVPPAYQANGNPLEL